MSSPWCRQFIAITPRSGSTWWCDLLARTGVGRPAEFLNEAGKWRQSRGSDKPPASWDELHEGLASVAKRNAYDLKASWFQFQPLVAGDLANTLVTEGFPNTTWTYLTRRDLKEQALSLYLMKRLGSAHSRRGSAPLDFSGAWFEPCPKNLDALMCWLLHVTQQEHGWETFFAQHGIEPWRCTYEEIARRPILSLRRYMHSAGRRGMPASERPKRPLLAARRATRRSAIVKREYPAQESAALLEAFEKRFRAALKLIDVWRGKESSSALQKRCALRGLDKSEMR